MGTVRTTRLVCLGIVAAAWLGAGRQVAWALPETLPPACVGPRAGGAVPVPPSAATSAYRPFEGELSPLEQSLFADAADGRWDQHSLLAAALVASGLADDEALNRHERQVANWIGELKNSSQDAGSAREKARVVFEFMHRRLLSGGYQVDCTDLTVALEEGRYNCVSASVLFHCLAGRFGLSVRGLEIPGHAMSRLVLADGTLDVETTCPGWFRLMDDPEGQARVVQRAMGQRGPEATLAAEPREVSDVQLAATIYYNRGVDLLDEKRFAEAAAANAKALRLDPTSATAFGNLLATINNWAVDLAGSGRHAEAIRLLRQGITLDGDYETFRVNYVYVHWKWIDELCRFGRFSQALDLITQAARQRIELAYFRQARLDVYRRWARAQLEAGRTDQAFEVFEEAKRLHGNLAEVLEVEAAEMHRHAMGLLRQGRPLEAVTLLDEALGRRPVSPALQDLRRAAAVRWGATADPFPRARRGGGVPSLLGK